MIIVNSRFLTQPITGVQRNAIEISRILKKICPEIRFVAPGNIVHHDIAKELGAETTGRLKGHLWEQLELPIFLKKQGRPLLISLATTAPLLYKRKIVSVHDLAFLHFPNAVSWKFRTVYKFLIPRVVSSSLHITTGSEFSKNDICEKYGTSPDHITIISNASSFVYKGGEHPVAKEKVIIAVGSMQPYKNIEALVSAFALFQEKHQSEYVLKLVGGLDKKVFQDTQLSSIIKSRNDVKLTGYLSDADLFSLYSSSTCFVFPSLFEGFGIPPLEAMACGCPVIASTAASIPEVCGDAAVYIDPYSIEDIAEKMSQVVDSPALQQEMVAKGYKNIERFSWEKCARSLWNIVEKYR